MLQFCVRESTRPTEGIIDEWVDIFVFILSLKLYLNVFLLKNVSYETDIKLDTDVDSK